MNDPVQEYLRKYKTAPASAEVEGDDPVASYLTKYGPPKRTVRQKLTGMAKHAGAQAGEAVTNAVAGAADLLGADKTAETIRRAQARGREVIGAPEGAADVAGAIVGRLGTEGAMFVAPGAALGKVNAVRKLSLPLRTAAQLAVDAPVDAAIAAGSPESSTAGFLAGTGKGDSVLGMDRAWLQSVAADPKKRAIFEAVTGATIGSVLQGAFMAPALVQKARAAIDIGDVVSPGFRDLEPEALTAYSAADNRVDIPRSPWASSIPYASPLPLGDDIAPAHITVMRRLAAQERAADDAAKRAAALADEQSGIEARRRALELQAPPPPAPAPPPPPDPRLVTPAPQREPLLVVPPYLGGGRTGPGIIQPTAADIEALTPTRRTPGHVLAKEEQLLEEIAPKVQAVEERPSDARVVYARTRQSARQLSDEELQSAWRRAYRSGLVADAQHEAKGGAGAATRAMVSNADPDARIGAVGTGRGAFERGRLTQARHRMEAIEAELKERKLEAPDPDHAFDDAALEELPSQLHDEFTARRQMEAQDLFRLADEAERAAAERPDDVNAQIRRNYLAGEVKRRELESYARFDEEGDELLSSARPGFGSREVIGALARGGVGAAAGAAIDQENPGRGAVVGATVVGGAPFVRKLTRALARSDQGRDFYRRVVDEKQPLRDFGRDVGGSEHLSHETSRASGWRGAANQQVNTEFRNVVKLADGIEKEVTELAHAERALELEANGLTGKYDLNRAKAAVAALSGNADVRRAVDGLRQYYRSLLEYKLQNGVITQDQFNAITSKGQYYVPFLRDMDDIPTAGGGKLYNRGTGVRKMKEGAATADIVDPFEQAIKDTYETHRTVAKQRVANVVADIVENNWLGAGDQIIRIAKADDAKKGRVVGANINGERRYYEVLDEQLYDAWASFDQNTQNIFVKVLGPFKKALQGGVTLLPDFAAANAMRDNVQSAIQHAFPFKSAARGAAVGAVAGAVADEDDRAGGALKGAGLGLGGGALAPQIARTLSAMKNIIGNDAVYQQWLKEGGSGMSEFYGTADDAKKLLKQMRNKRGIGKTIINPKNWVDVLRAIGRTAEESTRLAQFKELQRQGKGIAESIHGSRDISLDFANIGRDTKGYAAVTAFFNAKVQGWDKLARVMSDKRTWAAGAATITAPSIALWSINKDNPEYWNRPLWERNLFWLIPRSDGQFWRIPKPFEIGFAFASLPERMLDFAYQKDPESLKAGLVDIASTAAGGISALLPTAATPIVENVANKDFFRNRPVVSPGLEKLLPEFQYDERTSSLSVAIGDALGLSPQKMDNLLQDWTGSLGSEFLRATSTLARKAGADERADPTPARAPLVGRFSTRDDQVGEVETAVRRKYARAQKVIDSAEELVEQGRINKAKQLVQENRDLLVQYPELNEQEKFLADARKARRELVEVSDLSSEQKRRALVVFNRKVTDVLRSMGKQPAAAEAR